MEKTREQTIGKTREKTRLTKYIIPLVIFAIIAAVFTAPAFKNIHNWGIDDWDHFSGFYALASQSIAKYQQLPFWNPHSCGGTPLLEHPQVSIMPYRFILPLAAGLMPGIKLTLILYMIFGMFGMFLLSKQFNIKGPALYLPSILYMLSGVFVAGYAIGTDFYLAVAYIPYAFFFFLKSFEQKQFIIISAIFAALILLDGAVYFWFYTIMFILTYSLFKFILEKNKTIIKIFLAFIILTAIFSSVKIVSNAQILSERPRYTEELDTGFTIQKYYNALLNRNQKEFFLNYVHEFQDYNLGKPISASEKPWDDWEDSAAYIGIIPLIFALAGIIISFKKQKTLLATLIVFIWLSLGNSVKLSIWKVLHYFPILNQLRIPDRFRIIVVLILAIYAGIFFSKLCERLKPKYLKQKLVHLISITVIILIFTDLCLVNSPVIASSFTLQPLDLKPSEFQQTYQKNYSDIIYTAEDNENVCNLCAVLENKGLLNCKDPTTVRIAALHKDQASYRGEVYLKDRNGKINNVKFSPNKIVVEFTAAEPDILIINQNYYKYWRVDGKAALNHNGLIAANIDPSQSSVTFHYLPATFIMLYLFSITAIIIGLIYFFKK